MDSEIIPELQKALNRARGSARKRKLEFDIDIEFLRELWTAQKGHCDVSGLAFSDETHETARVKKPFAPSLDRIDPSKGYLKDNVRFVCTAANFGLNQWGDNVLRRISYGVVETERKVERAWYKQQRRNLRKAEKAAKFMTGEELRRQKRVIAGIKASITKGRARQKAAGDKASDKRSINSEVPKTDVNAGAKVRHWPV